MNNAPITKTTNTNKKTNITISTTTSSSHSNNNIGFTNTSQYSNTLNTPQRKKKTKPLSMNETLLNKIVNDVKKPKEIRNVPINKLSNNNNHSIDSLLILNSSSKTTNLNNHSKSSSNFLINKSIKKSSFHKSLLSLNEIPLPTKNLKKIPSNGIEITKPKINNPPNLKSENSLSSLTEKESNLNLTVSSTTNSNFKFTHNLNGLSKLKSFQSDTFKLNEELLEYKLKNSKLKNEINILNEKIKTFKQVITMKNSENELVKTKYSEMIEDYKREIEKMRKINNEYSSMIESKNDKNKCINSTLSIMIELFEIFILPRSSLPLMTRQSVNHENISNSYSMDIYESYNNDDDKRNTIIEQIQGLVVAKLNVMKRTFNLDLDKEIERVKNWNLKNNKENEVNISNLNLNLKLSKINDSQEKSYSNDLFDLSTSNQFIIQSPKFNNESIKIVENEYNTNKEIINFSMKKEEETGYQILNDSFLKDLKYNDSFGEDKSGSLIHNQNKNYNPFNAIERKATKESFDFNIADCSIIDLNIENSRKNTPTNSNLHFNYNAKDLNISASPKNIEVETNFIIFPIQNNLNTTFQNEDDVKTCEENNHQLILKSLPDLSLSFNG